MVTCLIQYTLDPFKVHEFEQYAKNWLEIIPRCGGDLIGYFLPHEGTNNQAIALINFESLAEYEAYRARLRADEDGTKNFKFAFEKRLIIEERRTFLRSVQKEKI